MKQNIIVTGGAQGIGKIITLELLKKDFQVAVFDIDTEAITEFKEDYQSENIEFFHTDVTSEKSVATSVNSALKKFGNITGLINNAGIMIHKPLTDLQFNEWKQVIDTNLTGAFLCSKYSIPHLKKSGGSIINISSTRAFQSEANTESYAASKGGIIALTHSLAISLGPEIKVNCISPGWIDVSAVKKKSAAKQYHMREKDHAQHPAGRVGKAKDVSNLILFLLGPENDFITGQNFTVDGGMTKKMIYEH